jgi:hypothetical protein
MAVEIVALLQEHGTGRVMRFKLSEYIHGPRYEGAPDRRRSHSDKRLIFREFRSVSAF